LFFCLDTKEPKNQGKPESAAVLPGQRHGTSMQFLKHFKIQTVHQAGLKNAANHSTISKTAKAIVKVKWRATVVAVTIINKGGWESFKLKPAFIYFKSGHLRVALLMLKLQ
jgi:hypothetical protein